MERWKRDQMHKSIDNYNKTEDFEHIKDVYRILTYSKTDVIIAETKQKIRTGIRTITNISKEIIAQWMEKLN